MRPPDDFEIIDCAKRPTSSFLNVADIRFRYRGVDGSMSDYESHEIARPDDAAAVLAVDRDQRTVILVRQFRVASVCDTSGGKGWLWELPAGRLKPHELPREAARRELKEETGYDLYKPDQAADLLELGRFELLCTFLTSPGITSERVHLFYVELDKTDSKVLLQGGAENTQPKHFEIEEFLAMIDRGEIADAKTIVASQWLRRKGLKRKASALKQPKRTLEMYEFDGDRGAVADKKRSHIRQIGIVPGDIMTMYQHVDEPPEIWVNSENTDMLMDRFFGKSLSATIRREGAEKLPNGSIYRDTIAEELKAQLGGNLFVDIGDVVPTGPGELFRKPHSVRCIFHAAAVKGVVGDGQFGHPQFAKECVESTLTLAHAMNKGRESRWRLPMFRTPYKAIAMPMFGAGEAGSSADEIVPAVVDAIVAELTKSGDAPLHRVYLLAYSTSDHRLIRRELERRVASGDLIGQTQAIEKEASRQGAMQRAGPVADAGAART